MRISDWSSYVCSSDLTATSWLDGQHRAFVAFGGVPRIAVPDNPKALVAKPNRYEPTLSTVYADFGRNYGIPILPAREIGRATCRERDGQYVEISEVARQSK